MIRIEPTANIKFQSYPSKTNRVEPLDDKYSKSTKSQSGVVIASLTALAATGVTIAGLIKTKPSNLAKAFEKAGVEVKDSIALKIGTGERFTGKIEHFVTRNEKKLLNMQMG